MEPGTPPAGSGSALTRRLFLSCLSPFLLILAQYPVPGLDGVAFIGGEALKRESIYQLLYSVRQGDVTPEADRKSVV